MCCSSHLKELGAGLRTTHKDMKESINRLQLNFCRMLQKLNFATFVQNLGWLWTMDAFIFAIYVLNEDWVSTQDLLSPSRGQNPGDWQCKIQQSWMMSLQVFTASHVHCELNTLMWVRVNTQPPQNCVSILSLLRFQVAFGRNCLTETSLAWQTAEIIRLEYWRITELKFKSYKEMTGVILDEVFIDSIHQ